MSDFETITVADPPAALAEAAAFRIPLPSVGVFDGLPPEARRALEDELEWFSLPGGRVLFEAGAEPDGLYLVLSGCLGVIRGTREQSELLSEVVAGGTVGDLALLSHRPQPTTVIALRDTSVARLCTGRADPRLLVWMSF